MMKLFIKYCNKSKVFLSEKTIICFLFFAFTFFACNTKSIFEDYQRIPDKTWNKENKIEFKVPITDTTSLHNFYVNIRNDGDYANGNIYIFLSIISPDGEIKTDTLNIILASPSGQWLGKGFGDIWDNQVLIYKAFNFKKSGEYTFILEQGMRQDLLPAIRDVGIKLELQ